MPPLSDFPRIIKTERLRLSVLKASTENAKCVGECDSLIYEKANKKN